MCLFLEKCHDLIKQVLGVRAASVYIVIRSLSPNLYMAFLKIFWKKKTEKNVRLSQ